MSALESKFCILSWKAAHLQTHLNNNFIKSITIDHSTNRAIKLLSPLDSYHNHSSSPIEDHSTHRVMDLSTTIGTRMDCSASQYFQAKGLSTIP